MVYLSAADASFWEAELASAMDELSDGEVRITGGSVPANRTLCEEGGFELDNRFAGRI